eukprot:764767-Hanusia_phi.AAC.3
MTRSGEQGGGGGGGGGRQLPVPHEVSLHRKAQAEEAPSGPAGPPAQGSGRHDGGAARSTAGAAEEAGGQPSRAESLILPPESSRPRPPGSCQAGAGASSAADPEHVRVPSVLREGRRGGGTFALPEHEEPREPRPFLLVLAELPLLRTLLLHGNQLEQEAVEALCPLLSSLESLDLSDNLLSCESVSSLASSLPRSVRLLRLAGNQLWGQGAEVLADGMRSWESLEELDLRGCWLGDDGAIEISIGMTCCYGLKRVLLASNSITNEGANAMAEGLEEMRVDVSWLEPLFDPTSLLFLLTLPPPPAPPPQQQQFFILSDLSTTLILVVSAGVGARYESQRNHDRGEPRADQAAAEVA